MMRQKIGASFNFCLQTAETAKDILTLE